MDTDYIKQLESEFFSNFFAALGVADFSTKDGIKKVAGAGASFSVSTFGTAVTAWTKGELYTNAIAVRIAGGAGTIFVRNNIIGKIVSLGNILMSTAASYVTGTTTPDWPSIANAIATIGSGLLIGAMVGPGIPVALAVMVTSIAIGAATEAVIKTVQNHPELANGFLDAFNSVMTQAQTDLNSIITFLTPNVTMTADGNVILTPDARPTNISVGGGQNMVVGFDSSMNVTLTYDQAKAATGTDLIVGTSGADTFTFTNATDAAFTVIYGGGGGDTYNFLDCTVNIVELNMNFGDANLAALDMQKFEQYIVNTYGQSFGSDIDGKAGTIVILNPSSDDKIILNGKTLTTPDVILTSYGEFKSHTVWDGMPQYYADLTEITQWYGAFIGTPQYDETDEYIPSDWTQWESSTSRELSPNSDLIGYGYYDDGSLRINAWSNQGDLRLINYHAGDFGIGLPGTHITWSYTYDASSNYPYGAVGSEYDEDGPVCPDGFGSQESPTVNLSDYLLGGNEDDPDPDHNPPTPQDDWFDGVEDKVLTIAAADLLANDQSEGPLDLIWADNAVGGTVGFGDAGNIIFTREKNYHGPASFSYWVVDDQDGVGQATVHIDLVNHAPELDHPLEDQVGLAGSPVMFGLDTTAFKDIDDDDLSFTVQSLPDWLYFDGTTFVGTPPNDFSGSFQIEVTASDGELEASTVFSLIITPADTGPGGDDGGGDDGGGDDDGTGPITIVNHAPVLVHALANQTSDQGHAINVRLDSTAFVDPDGDALSYTAMLSDGSALPSWLIFDGTTFTGTPPAGFTGSLDIRVTASDGQLSANGVFNLTVAPVAANVISGDGTLWGTEGDDIIYGGAGNDVYVVDDPGDIVDESLPGSGGIDTVLASISYTLPYGVENLSLTGTDNINGTGNELDNFIIGNSGNNTLIGGAGNDILDGGAGDDILMGGTGSDVYIWRTGDGNDRIIEDGLESDEDRVELHFNASNVAFSRDGLNLIITNTISGETLTVENHFVSRAQGIEMVLSADGVAWDRTAIDAATSAVASPASAPLEIAAGCLKIDSQISQLVQAMASYSANGSGFDPTGSSVHTLPNESALQNAVTAAWH